MTEATSHHVCEGAVVLYKRDGSKYFALSPSGAFLAVESFFCSFNHPETRLEGHPGTFPQGGRSFCERVADLFDFRWPIFLRASKRLKGAANK
jgi:hypothetical protein